MTVIDRTSHGGVRVADLHLFVLGAIALSAVALRVGYPTPDRVIHALEGANLFVVFALAVIYHLIRDHDDRASATNADLLLALAVVGALAVGGLFATRLDLAAVMLALGLWYRWRPSALPQGRFIAIVYLALGVNGLLAPLLFQLFKPFFLIGEAQFAAWLLRLGGMNVIATEAHIAMPGGTQLQLVGACSVFSNLSLSVVGWAGVKAAFRSSASWRDIYWLGLLAGLLIVGNAVRIGLMLPSQEAYEFWHTGGGLQIFSIGQFLVIMLVAAGAARSGRVA